MLTRSLATLTVVASLGLAAGCRPHIDPKDPDDRAWIARHAASRVDDALDDADATDSQKKALAGLEKPVLDEGFRLWEGQAAAKDTLWTEWKSPSPDAAKVHAVVDERVDGLRKVLHLAADAILKAHATLTPEQRATLAEEYEHRR